MHTPHRFVALDALRGVAALFVVGFHLSQDQFPHGYLALDFFFLLSGFVVSFAYQNRLDAGKVSEFAKTRTLRLYPLYLLGLSLGLALALTKHMLHFQQFTLRNIGLATLLGLFLLPLPSMANGLPVLFPLDTPAWTLFDEVLANICHASFWRRRGIAVPVTVLLISAIALFYAALTHEDLDVGYQQASAVLGIVRCFFSYSAGMILYVLWRRGFPTRAMPFPLTVLLLGGSFLLPRLSHVNALDDLPFIFVVFPCLLWSNINTAVQQPLRPAFTVLAEASYALYIIHMPLLGFMMQGWNRMSHHAAPAGWAKLVFTGLIVAFAVAADRLYDRPVRRALNAKTAARPGS